MSKIAEAATALTQAVAKRDTAEMELREAERKFLIARRQELEKRAEYYAARNQDD